MKWRNALAPIALIALALSASYGVYRFQVHFTPWYVAAISATSFELTYAGLAVLQTKSTGRATAISIGAVVVSVVYNSLSALFDIRPALFTDAPLWGHAVLAALHGVPLAVVAFLVADLLLHSNADVGALVFSAARIAEQPHYPPPVPSMPQGSVVSSKTSRAYVCPNCSVELTLGAYGAAKKYGYCKTCKGG